MTIKRKKRARPLSDLERKIAELEAQLTPEQRAIYEEACEIRRRIGKVPFKVTDLVREIRGDDD